MYQDDGSAAVKIGPFDWYTGGAAGREGDTDVVVNNFNQESTMNLSFLASDFGEPLTTTCFSGNEGVFVIRETKLKRNRGTVPVVSFVFNGAHSDTLEPVQYSLEMEGGDFTTDADGPGGDHFPGWFYGDTGDFQKTADDSPFEPTEFVSAHVTEWSIRATSGKARKGNDCGKGEDKLDSDFTWWVEVSPCDGICFQDN